MTKVDIISFGAVISLATDLAHRQLNHHEVGSFHIAVADCINKEQPAGTVSCEQVDALLLAMKNDHKIEAIKAYRAMTGQGLLESKNAIEKYRTSNYAIEKYRLAKATQHQDTEDDSHR